MDVGARIARLRKARAWTQAELAHQAGVTQQYISDLERDGDGIGLMVAARITVALGAPLTALLDDAPFRPSNAVLFPLTVQFLETELPSVSPAHFHMLDRQVVGNLRTALSLLSAAAPSQPAATALPSGDTAEPARGSVNWPSRTMGRLWSGAMQRIKVAGRATVLARPVAALEG